MAKGRAESRTGIQRRGGSLLVYTGSKVIEAVELESKQCFLNPHKYSVHKQPILDAIT